MSSDSETEDGFVDDYEDMYEDYPSDDDEPWWISRYEDRLDR